MLDRVVRFSNALRETGLPVALTDTTDALRALTEVPLGDRAAVKNALGATLVKRQAHLAAFDTLFELYFPASSPHPGGEPDPVEPGRPEAERERMIEELYEAIASGDAAAMNRLVAEAVAGFGRLERTPDWYSNYEVSRALGLDEIAARLAREAEEADVPDLERQLLLDEFRRRIQQVRDEILRETRVRTAEIRGPEAVARYAVSPVVEEMTFTAATADMAELRRAVRPLARKLATAVALKRKRATRGHVDIRKTIRHSLSTGGVPIDVSMKHRTPHRPELLLLCDVSSSVARFSRFTLMLTHALRTQFQKVRAFAFINTPDEVTEYLEHEDFAVAMEQLGKDAVVDSYDGRTDYGRVFQHLLEGHADAIGPKTTVLILGDARSNYRSRNVDDLKEMAHRARHVFWLNPEPVGDWDIGDSAASEYAAHVDSMVEVRNLKQLHDFIAKEL